MPDVMGVVPLIDRDPLAYAVLAGRALLLSAAATLTSAGAEPVIVVAGSGGLSRAGDALREYEQLADLVECPEQDSIFRERASAARVVVIHDPLCPLVTPTGIRAAVRGWVPGTATVSVRPVVDTVKAARDGEIRETVDRDSFRIVSSPVVLSGALLAKAPDVTTVLGRPAALVEWLRTRCAVTLATAPPASQRVEDLSSLDVLAAMGAVSG
jgi:2-C-methyl-D-erythritol 4-phosphate cytidylyltransferase